MKKEKAFVEREEAKYNIKEHIMSGLIISGLIVIVLMIVKLILIL